MVAARHSRRAHGNSRHHPRTLHQHGAVYSIDRVILSECRNSSDVFDESPSESRLLLDATVGPGSEYYYPIIDLSPL